MKPSLLKLHKFFKLEAERGYDNHAVVGGLDRMLDRWEAEALAEGVPQELIQAVVTRVRDYPRLTPTSRAEALQGLWRRIQRSEEDAPGHFAPEPPPAPTPPQEPAPRQVDRPVSDRQKGEPKKSQPHREKPHRGGQAPTANSAPQAKKADIEDEDQYETAGEDGFANGTAEPEFQPEQTTRARAQAQPSGPPAALNAPVTVLQGVGARHAQVLEKLGIKTLRDMLYYLPRRYDDYSLLKPINRLWYGEEVTVIGTVKTAQLRPVRGGKMQIVEAVVTDGTGGLRVTWFNQPWIAKRLRSGTHIVLSGKVDQYLGRLVMNSPEWEPLEQQQLSTNRIVPVYPLTANITQRWLRRLLNQVVTYWAPRVPDPLPPNLRRSADVMDLPMALMQAHFPDSWDDLKAARQRLAFDEILLLQLGVLRQKQSWQERTARAFETSDEWLEEQLSRLPFALTQAQTRSLQDVRQDLASGRPMNRLLQGDVGSGKTIVAAMAIAMLAKEGTQTALMAPTSILAEQHYRSMLRLLAGQPQPEAAFTGEGESGQALEEESRPAGGLGLLRPDEIRLMLGTTSEAEKREIRAGLEDGNIKVVVGTHALIEEPVKFANLQLAIVDEQHRFGVDQRAALRTKGDNPHLLVMTATPIPRSLALTVYGDLDLSVIDEMPPGRQPVNTYVLPPRERERAYTLVRSQVEKGRQAFFIYPLVEESDKSDSKAAVEEHARLQNEIFPRLKLGLLHGRMKPEEKEEVMTRFRDGEYHILVSTSVVEVGVDVPNATVMVIEGANRFGLAQLHQFRGRVGRSSEKSYCLLIPETPDEVENERLQVMAETNDGFVLAERDLEQRGPGQFLGTRQSGYTELQFAKLTDVQLVEKARFHAQNLFSEDAELSLPQHQLLRVELERFWGQTGGDIS